MRRSPIVRSLASLFVLLVAAGAAARADEAWKPTTVVLVRHAEKAAEPKDDPSLSPAGDQRAQALAGLLAQAGVTRILATDTQRTQQTAAPLAARLGVGVDVLAAKNTAATVEMILKSPGKTTLVVGHSNTLGPIIQGLGGGEVPLIADDDFGNLFVVTITAPGKATVLRLRY
jgi:broad specificity phosphatase PhoE